jgi:hypothetical protein
MLTRLIYQHVIGTFNTCSRGLTHRSSTDTGVGYNLGGIWAGATTLEILIEFPFGIINFG